MPRRLAPFRILRFTGRMVKLDFRQERTDLYSPPREFTEVVVPEFSFLMVDGRGDPNTDPRYAEAVEALYSVSYAAKFASKQQLDRDWVVAPLEGLWWSDDPVSFSSASKADWNWTMMIRQPDWLTADLMDAAFAKSAKKELPALGSVRLESFAEGRSVQILHIGPYDDEAPTVARLHDEYLPQLGLVENGQHHEVYLGDPRRTEPDRLKTILRQPVAEK